MAIAQPQQLNKIDLPQVIFTETKKQRLKAQAYAPLEPKTQKILEKLKKRLNHFDKQITEDRLKDTRLKIKYWINRHTAQRVLINKKDFKLFSEGRDTAKMSRRVEALRECLRNSYQLQVQSTQDLKGRVTKA